jgi:hypothetical protein
VYTWPVVVSSGEEGAKCGGCRGGAAEAVLRVGRHAGGVGPLLACPGYGAPLLPGLVEVPRQVGASVELVVPLIALLIWCAVWCIKRLLMTWSRYRVRLVPA